ncbi:MAG: TonB-dependent receptor [Kofleriaceae bacterium]|nr:TonB-dependent receptor [Kofleriaceae bacterium]
MIRSVVFILACLCAPAALADPVGTGAPEECTGTLDGHVVEKSTHEALPGANVSANGQYLADTDAAGRFTLRNLCTGEIEILIQRPDCASTSKTVVVPDTGSVEIEVATLDNEVIEVEDKAPPPADMRSVAVVSGEALERTRGRAFSDALAEVAGVAQLRTANGMAKPIVRGQFGRRLLMLVDGVRHRSQDWGIDHTPEIDPFIADSLTVVRGASGVRFGPDAIGGAVLADPPPLLREPGLAGEAHVIGASNGLGGTLASRLRGAPEAMRGLAWQLEGSYKRLAAPSTPDYALDNTGVLEWNAGAALGYRRRNAEYTLSYRHYQAKLGVCNCLRVESREDFYAQLERDRPLGAELYTSELAIERPYQAPAHDLALGRARWKLSSGTLTATYALQYDHRREYDIVRAAVTGPQFDFKLTSHDVEVAYEHAPIHLSDHWHLRGAAGVVGGAQVHHYSGLQLVPDYQSVGVGAFALERLVGHDVELEAGVRYDVLARTADLERIDFLRLVRSGQIAMDACGDASGDSIACASTFQTVSASVGGLVRLTDAWSVKLDASTASRPPNTDEQYLNGTSPTFPVLALGKPDLRPETTYSASLTTTYHSSRVNAELSGFANLIDDYIYFAPAINDMGMPIFDVLVRGTFPRFATRPVDSMFYGVDGGITAAPAPWLELGAQLSVVRAKNTDDDSYLAFIPPDQARASVTLKRASLGGLGKSFAMIAGTLVRKQTRYELASDFAAPPDAYALLGAELGTETTFGSQTVKFALQGTNLTNARYRDYTSLLRYFADQPGRQVLFRVSLSFQ